LKRAGCAIRKFLMFVSPPPPLLQVHDADPPQMHVGHPANQLQPRQQHPDRRVRRRLHLALGPAALRRPRDLSVRRPSDLHCKKCPFEHLILRGVFKKQKIQHFLFKKTKRQQISEKTLPTWDEVIPSVLFSRRVKDEDPRSGRSFRFLFWYVNIFWATTLKNKKMNVVPKSRKSDIKMFMLVKCSTSEVLAPVCLLDVYAVSSIESTTETRGIISNWQIFFKGKLSF